MPDNFWEDVINTAVEAGNKILEIYKEDFDVDWKNDSSPLTQADRNSHDHITEKLKMITPHIPVFSEESDNIDWTNPRLLCIAGDFTKYDEHAVKQMNRNIELIRYRKFRDDLLLLELVNVTEANGSNNTSSHSSSSSKKEVTDYIESANKELTDLYHALRDYLLNLGDDVQEKTLKHYIAYKRIKNFACVEIHPQSQKLYVYLKVNPDEVELKEGFTRDVRQIGQYGTGDLEITIRTISDLEQAESLIFKSYDLS